MAKEVQTLGLKAAGPILNLFNVMMELVRFLAKKMVDQRPLSVPAQTVQSCQSAPRAQLHKLQQLNVLMELSE